MPLPCYDDLDATLVEAWARLSRGVRDRRSPFHTPVLASIGADGAPQARTLVLRGVDPSARLLRFHTDVRSAKAAALTGEPRVAVHAYCPTSKIQLRLAGTATLHGPGTEIAQMAFARSQEKSRVCYAQARPPGTRMDGPGDAVGGEGGEENFSVIEIAVERLEWLYLHATGHRRARFIWVDGTCSASWLAP